nr:uncharacterized protein LOC109743182 [Aegilops tauschii subsp. strangulata]
MSRLGEELAGVYSRLEAEGLRLADEWRKLRVAVNLGRYQRDHDNAKAEVEVCRAALASLRGTRVEQEEVRRRQEALALEAVERSIELEHLEPRERQVAQAEDAIGAREAKVQEEVDRQVARVRADLEGRYDLKLKLAGTEDAGRAAALRPRLAKAERRVEASAVALAAALADLASARAELLLLQKRVDDAEAFARQNREEVLERRTLERVHAPMLQDLRNKGQHFPGPCL